MPIIPTLRGMGVDVMVESSGLAGYQSGSILEAMGQWWRKQQFFKKGFFNKHMCIFSLTDEHTTLQSEPLLGISMRHQIMI